LQLIPLLAKTKELYLEWYGYQKTLPKEHRFSLGQKIDTLLVEIIEAISAASFLARMEKLPYIRLAIRKTDALKIFFMLLWETKSLDTKKFISLSAKINEIGKMLGGWNGQLTKTYLEKQNSPIKR
jgi:hypothetical protein